MAIRWSLILHVAYAFVPLGFVLSGLAALTPAVAFSAGLHAWAVGAVGGMTLAVMTRASLGHTGQALRADKGTQAIYGAVLLAATARIARRAGAASKLCPAACRGLRLERRLSRFHLRLWPRPVVAAPLTPKRIA